MIKQFSTSFVILTLIFKLYEILFICILPSQKYDFVIAVRQSNQEILRQKFLQVSDPQNIQYGKYLSYKEIGELIQNEESTNLIMNYLNNIGFNKCNRTKYGEFIRCKGESSQKFLQEKPNILKEQLNQHIVGVFDSNELKQQIVATQYGVRSFQDGAQYCTPDFLFQNYNIPKNNVVQGSQSVFETSGQFGSPSDLVAFQKKYNLPQTQIFRDIGGNLDDNTCTYLSYECGEANLDLQYIMAIGQNIPTWFWSTDKTTTFAHWIMDVSSMPDGPLVHSVSYGQLESETGDDLMNIFSTEVMKLGLRGVSVLVSSGDDGVMNPKTRTSSGLCDYTPQWPATCPWVTTVGATQGPEELQEEKVCSSQNNNTYITSGGGFSNSFETPQYQQNVVNDFLKNKSNALGPGFNEKGRGYPDVALIGHLYPIINGGEINIKDGTSASTPVMAGIISLVNARRLAQGKSPVGFANPALYQWANNDYIFNDVVKGQNNCAAGGWNGNNVVCCEQHGFHATKGWDPASGLGSINVANLIDAWEKL